MSNNSVIPVYPGLAKNIGLEESLVLQQIKYWTEKCGKTVKEENGLWIYNSLENWHEQFSYWSLSKLRRIITSLEKKKLIKSKKHNAKKWNHTKWYSIEISNLTKILNLVNINAVEYFKNIKKRCVQFKQIINIQNNNIQNNYLSNKTQLTTINKKTQSYIYEREIKKLVDIWETKILNNQIAIKLTKTRIQKLEYIFTSFFNSELNEWEKFLNQILESKFLMGKVTNFKISFDWILIKDNVLKIIEGNYSNQNKKTEYNPNTELECVKSVNELEENKTLDERWKNLLKKLIKTLGNGIYLSWFSKLRFLSDENGCLHLKAQSDFQKKWIESNYKKYILEMGSECFGINKVVFS